MKDSKKPEVNDIIFSPTKIKDKTIEVIGDRVLHPRSGIETGIKPLDKWLLPLRPTEVTGVLGFTSNFKTGVMNNMARYHAHRIRRENLHPQIVVRFDWEQTVEEQGVIDLAQATQIDAKKMMRGELDLAEWDRLQEAAKDREKLPLWLVGHSSEETKTRRPRMSMRDVEVAMAFIVDTLELTPALVVIDYLQRIKRMKREMRESFIDIVDDIKDLAVQFHCPVVLGCQAKRDVKKRKWRMPQADDAQETSNFEQTCDKLIGVWMPKNDFPENHKLPFGKDKVGDTKHYIVTPNMLLINIIKQKFGESPVLIKTFVKYETSEIYLMSEEE
ncbi:MAG: DnaB-like helicase C-terminal domain-containing protein [Planctomycetota bacterium]|jgi:replicative DNA helicase